MSDLTVDFDTMKKTIEKYTELIDDLRKTKKGLQNDIDKLRQDYWVSEAGDEFQNIVAAKWGEELEKYLATLEFMREELKVAYEKYGDVAEKARKL